MFRIDILIMKNVKTVVHYTLSILYVFSATMIIQLEKYENELWEKCNMEYLTQ